MRSLIKSLINIAYTYLKAHCLIRAFSELFAKCVRPRPELLLFGAMNGRWYGDNSRHLYEWALEHHKDWEVVWLTSNRSVLKTLKAKGQPVEDMRTLRGLFYIYRAKRAVFTNSLSDLCIFPFLIPNRLRLVALRHGRSVKKIRFAREGHILSPKERRERMRESELVEYAISTSEFASEMQETCLRIGRKKHIVTGYPRNDSLIGNANHASNESILSTFNITKTPQSIILYAPSWRHGREATRFFPFDDFDISTLGAELEHHNVLLLLRPHVRDLETQNDQAQQLREFEQSSERIRLASHKIFPDINSILPNVDALLTDYSALYHDYLLLDRPIGFIPYDYEDFKKENGFLYDYLDLMPGPRISRTDDFVQFVSDVVLSEDRFVDQRQRLCEKLHRYNTPDACQRTAELIDSLRYSHHAKPNPRDLPERP